MSKSHAIAVDYSRTRALGILCGIGAATCWAASFIGARHGLDAGLSPLDLLVHRYLWSGLAFLPIVLRGGIADLNGIGWGRGIALAVLGGAGFAVISYAGFLVVPLGHGGVIQPSCGTLVGLLLAALFLRERLGTQRVIGAMIIVCGVVIIGIESVMRTGLNGVAGDLIFVLTGSMFAGFATLLRLWQVPSARAAMVVSVLSLVVVPIDALLGGFARLAAVGWQENLVQLIVQGIVAGPASLYLFARAVDVLGAGRAAVFPSLVPPLVLLLAWIVLGEQPTAIQLSGLVVALCGFQLAQRG
jgi:drug/metabolite transporter (DMT)-like permease